MSNRGSVHPELPRKPLFALICHNTMSGREATSVASKSDPTIIDSVSGSKRSFDFRLSGQYPVTILALFRYYLKAEVGTQPTAQTTITV